MNTTHAQTSQSGESRKPIWHHVLDWLGFVISFAAGMIMLVCTGLRLANEPGDYVSKNTMGLFVGAVACLFAASLARPCFPKANK